MKVLEKPKSFYEIFERKGGPEPDATHYCPGCGHGIVHKLIAEAIDELKIQDRVIFISPVGCSVFAYYYFDTGNVQVAHGRAPAVATGIKRARPDSIVISYQGDGDLAAIGGNNILQAANRGENITVFFVNNAIYGMTGGQLAPTSPIGMKTTTTPSGRAFEEYGSPMRMAELLSQLDGPSFCCRHSLTNPAKINRTRVAIKKALQYQLENKGFSFVEILAQCPTGWKVDPTDSIQWIEENMEKIYPLGVFKDQPRERLAPPHPAIFDPQRAEQTLGIEHRAGAALAPLAQAPWSRGGAGSDAQRDTLRLKAAGFGGQGILLLGELLAEAGMRQGLKVTWLPSYGPEMRGGTANCAVVASVREIGNPMVDRPDVLVAMNRPSLDRFLCEVTPGGHVFYDSSLIDVTPDRNDVHRHAVPATQVADAMGASRVANVVMMGAMLRVLGFPRRDLLEEAVAGISKNEKILAANRKAIEEGIAAAERECGAAS
jgi:2-oxoisovalerate ferredoxin oxidoreductase beta subunit